VDQLHNIVKRDNISNQNLLRDGVAGCFYCLSCFPATQIKDWVADRNGPTACCPFCHIDAVLPESALEEIGSLLFNDPSLSAPTVYKSLQQCNIQFFNHILRTEGA